MFNLPTLGGKYFPSGQVFLRFLLFWRNTMSIQIPGTLVIKTITGRYGDFNTAKLSTSIGEFVIKDAVLDPYTAGR